MVQFIAQFENHDSAAQAVMPRLDGSELHWRYPYYDIEIRDSTGKSIGRPGRSRCGNIDPLHTRDIVLLQPGEIFRTWFGHYYMYGLPPGTYRARLRYTAKQDLSKMGLSGPDDPDMREQIKSVWEGTIESNWIDINVTAQGATTQSAQVP